MFLAYQVKWRVRPWGQQAYHHRTVWISDTALHCPLSPWAWHAPGEPAGAPAVWPSPGSHRSGEPCWGLQSGHHSACFLCLCPLFSSCSLPALSICPQAPGFHRRLPSCALALLLLSAFLCPIFIFPKKRPQRRLFGSFGPRPLVRGLPWI